MVDSANKKDRVTGLLWLLALTGTVAALKRFSDPHSWETQLLIVAIGLFGIFKLLSLFREQTTSLPGILGVVAAVVACGAVAIVGIPESARRVPGLMDLTLITVPILLLGAAVFGVLLALSKWRGHGEFAGMAQRPRMTVVINLILAAAAWQVVRQSASMGVIQGLVRLPELRERRLAVEQMVNEMLTGISSHPTVAVLAKRPERSHAPTDPAALRILSASSQREPWVQARLAESQGDYETAARSWIRAADNSGHDPVLEATAVRALVRAGMAVDALSRVELLRQQGMNSPELCLLRAYLLTETGRINEAAEAYEPLLIANHGSDADIRRYLALMVELGETRHALRTTERLLVKRPNRRLHRWRACLQAAEGDYDNALTTLRRLTHTVPFDPIDAYRLGEIANDAGQPEVALNAVTALLRAGQKTARTTRIAAHACTALGVPLSHTGLSNSSATPLRTRSAGAGEAPVAAKAAGS